MVSGSTSFERFGSRITASRGGAKTFGQGKMDWTTPLTHTSPLHIPPFTNLRTLQLCEILIPANKYTICLGGLGPAVRELWLRDCRMVINCFVSSLRPFMNLGRLRLWDSGIPALGEIQCLDCAEPLYSRYRPSELRWGPERG